MECHLKLPERNPVVGIVTGKYLEQANKEVFQFLEKQIHQLERLGYKIIKTDAFGNIETINTAHRNI